MLRKRRRELWAHVRRIGANTWVVFRQTWLWWLLLWLASLPVLLWLSQWDAAWLEALRQPKTSTWHELARFISKWGDFYGINLILLFGGSALAWSLRNRKWQRYLLTVFLAAAVAGLAVQLPRVGLGRPRPSANVADGFYGPSLDHAYQGFPSGHASVAFTTGTCLSVLYPPIAPVALPAAASVGWARMQLNRHHPTDILAGAVFGTTFGVTFALATRHYRRLRTIDRRQPEGTQ